MNSKTWLGMAGGLLVGGVILLVVLVGSRMNNAAAHEYRITIPAGTAQRIAAGEDPAIVPAEIRLARGDILVIHNQDESGHQISDFWVGAGETIRQQFRQAGVYQGECTIHKDSQVQIIVTE
jgi:plastocyanin